MREIARETEREREKREKLDVYVYISIILERKREMGKMTRKSSSFGPLNRQG